MTESTDNSSLPMLLAITGAIVVVAVGGWFYLEQADTPPAEPVAQPASFDSLVEPEETTSEATSTADDGGAPKVKAEH